MRAFLRMVSIRDVAVMMCEEPAVSEVKRYSAGSSSQLCSSDILMSGKLPIGVGIEYGSRE
jgi:hypothetical protein